MYSESRMRNTFTTRVGNRKLKIWQMCWKGKGKAWKIATGGNAHGFTSKNIYQIGYEPYFSNTMKKYFYYTRGNSKALNISSLSKA